jgi:Zn-finger nucleic acid-binding protein
MNEEKDRFGDFIRLLERAREDIYFAEKDRALLDHLRRRLERAQLGQLQNPSLKCPQCGVGLYNATFKALPVRRCSGCGGIWIDHAVLREFTDGKEITKAARKTGFFDDAQRNVWPAGLSGMGRSFGGG